MFVHGKYKVHIDMYGSSTYLLVCVKVMQKPEMKKANENTALNGEKQQKSEQTYRCCGALFAFSLVATSSAPRRASCFILQLLFFIIFW